MASANLDLVRSIYVAWERGDFTSDEWVHPEIEVVFTDGPTPGSLRGITGFTDGWRDFLSTWEGLSLVVDEYLELMTNGCSCSLASAGGARRAASSWGRWGRRLRASTTSAT
jgi:hypothetical protein